MASSRRRAEPANQVTQSTIFGPQPTTGFGLHQHAVPNCTLSIRDASALTDVRSLDAEYGAARRSPGVECSIGEPDGEVTSAPSGYLGAQSNCAPDTERRVPVLAALPLPHWCDAGLRRSHHHDVARTGAVHQRHVGTAHVPTGQPGCRPSVRLLACGGPDPVG
jgi:hypothetical protein